MIKEIEFKPTLSLSLSLSHDGWPLGEFNTKNADLDEVRAS
jgi:hypothetical protein